VRWLEFQRRHGDFLHEEHPLCNPAASQDASHAESEPGTNSTALTLAVARFKERWPQIQLDYDPVLLSPKSVLPRLGYLTGPGGAGVTLSEATAQMFDRADPDRPVKAFLREHQTLFGKKHLKPRNTPKTRIDKTLTRTIGSPGG
jgi:hypothetical protein